MNETLKIEYKPGCCYVMDHNGVEISAGDRYRMSSCCHAVSD